MCGSRGGIGGPDPPGKSQVIWGSIEISICGAATSKFFGPVPCGPVEGSKGQISFNFNYKSQFQRQMKDTKYIRWDFHSVAWVMPQGWDFGALGVPR